MVNRFALSTLFTFFVVILSCNEPNTHHQPTKLFRDSTAALPDSVALESNLDAFDLLFCLQPILHENNLSFVIDLVFRGDSSGQTKVVLPNDYGGQDHFDSIQNLQAISPNIFVEDTDQRHIKRVNHPPAEPVRLRYQVVETRHGTIRLGDHYRVVLRKDYFHFMGEAIYVLPDWQWEKPIAAKLLWRNIPSGWTLANSFGIDQMEQEAEQLFWKFRFSIYTGGNYRILTRYVENQPIHTAITGTWRFSDNQFVDMVRDIVKANRDFWNDYDFPYFLVTLLPIGGSEDQGGTGRINSFGLFLSDDKVLDYRLKRVLTHEAFHTWNGGKIGKSQPEVLVYWFSEGFSDYYARLLLLRAGLITFDEYVKEYNKILDRYFSSPIRLAENKRLLEENSGDMYRLPYFRGDIVAHQLNAAIQTPTSGKASLDNVMHDLFAAAQENGTLVSDSSFRAIVGNYLDAQKLDEIMQAVESGVQPHDVARALGPCIEREMTSRRKYYLLGEKFEIPQYRFNKTNIEQIRCLQWFGME